MDFQTFHRYNRLVRRGLVKPLKCPHCDYDYVLRLTDDDEPGLECFMCLSIVKPGKRVYDDIRAVVKEFFE